MTSSRYTRRLGVVLFSALLVLTASPVIATADTDEPVLFASADGELLAYRYDTGQVLDIGPVQGKISLSPDGRRIAAVSRARIAHQEAGGLPTLLDFPNPLRDREASWSGESNEFTFTDGHALYIADVIENRIVSVSDVDPPAEDLRGHLGSSFAPNGRLVASVDWSTTERVLSVYDLDAQSRTIIDRHSSQGLASPRWSPSGDVIAYWKGNVLQLIEPSSGAVSILAEHTGQRFEPKWSPSGDRVAFWLHQGDHFYPNRSLVSIDVAGNRTTVVTDLSERATEFVWIDDETLVYAEDDRVREVTLGGQERELFRAPSTVRGLTFGANASQDWLPLVPSGRSTALACPSGQVPSAGFGDVGPSNTHARSIDCVAWWQVAQGTADASYSPSDAVSRAQMATFIARAITESGSTLPSAPPSAFGDVGEGTHSRSINQLADAGIVGGTGGGNYSPERLVTRAQMATFLANAYAFHTGSELPDARGDYFLDDQGNTHEDRINRAAEAGLTGGTGDRQYTPDAPVQRDQMATFLARLLDIFIEETDAAAPTH